MNATATIMQTTDWSKYSTEDWFRQFGAWINGNTENKRKFYKCLPTKKLTQIQREALLVHYIKDKEFKEPRNRCGVVCQITDNEARAFQRIVLDIRAIDSEPLQDWMDVLWELYVEDESLRKTAKIFNTSLLQVRQDLKCGLAFMSGRYPVLKSDFLKL